jgi:uncharacterized membrane protein
MGKLLKSASIVFLFIAYPFLSAYLVGQGFSSLELLVFAALTVWRGLKLEMLALRISALLLAALLLAGAYFANTYFIWLIPSFVYLWLTALFGHTLWSPPSLCERLVRLQYPEFIPGIAEYLREVTWAWTLFFAVNGVVCTLLPVLVGQRAWAIYTGMLVYVLMGCLFAGEWIYRHRRFPNLDIPPAMETIKYMVRHGHKAFKGVWT